MTITFFISIWHLYEEKVFDDDDYDEWHKNDIVWECGCVYARQDAAYAHIWGIGDRWWRRENCQVKARWYNSHIIIAIIAQCNHTKFIILWWMVRRERYANDMPGRSDDDNTTIHARNEMKWMKVTEWECENKLQISRREGGGEGAIGMEWKCTHIRTAEKPRNGDDGGGSGVEKKKMNK